MSFFIQTIESLAVFLCFTVWKFYVGNLVHLNNKIYWYQTFFTLFVEKKEQYETILSVQHLNIQHTDRIYFVFAIWTQMDSVALMIECRTPIQAVACSILGVEKNLFFLKIFYFNATNISSKANSGGFTLTFNVCIFMRFCASAWISWIPWIVCFFVKSLNKYEY